MLALCKRKAQLGMCNNARFGLEPAYVELMGSWSWYLPANTTLVTLDQCNQMTFYVLGV